MAKPTFSLTLAVGVLAFGFVSGARADATAEMLANSCTGCHGQQGNSLGPTAPSIAAMAPTVFVETMERFKSGETYSTIMGRIAKGYSSDEIKKMGEYFQRQQYQYAAQTFDKTLAKKGAKLHEKYCEKCHTDGGRPVTDEEDYNILAGQWVPYLQYTMEDFREGRRPMEKKMKSKLDELLKAQGDDGLAAVFAFYASQR